MEGAHHPLGRIAFEPYEIDFQTGELRKYGIRVRLQAQPLQLLAILVERRGAIVSRDELKAKLWPTDSFGDFDHGLNKAINKIREALSDSALNPRYIETIARRGYRFIAPVTAVQASNSLVPSALPRELAVSDVPAIDLEVPETKEANEGSEGKASGAGRLPKPFPWKIAGAFVILLLAVFVVWKLRRTGDTSSHIRSLAVLPLQNLSTDRSQEYFADGMTDELITALGTINGLRVISRTSVMLYKGVRRPLPQIARELGVDAVVEGTVLQSGEQVRITAQLIRASTDEHLWAQSYQGDLKDTLKLQDKVAYAIADRIRLTVRAREHALLDDEKPVNPAAYDAYLRGRYFWNKRTNQGLKKAVDYFNQSIAEDPWYARAYSGLADSYALLGDWEFGVLTPQEAFPKAEGAAKNALKLDDNLGEAHASLGLCLKSFDWDWKGAQRELSRAIELSPSYATAHQWSAWNLIILGRTDEGISELRKAEVLDPLSLVISADVADALVIAHKYDESMRQSRKTIEMDPSFAMAHYQLAQALVQTHQYSAAVAELQESLELSRGNPICTSLLGYVYALSGNASEARKRLAELENEAGRKQSNAANIALIYAGLNEKDQAFAWLQKAYEARFNPSVLLRPAFDVLHSDRRFQDLLRRLGLS
jgi:TolB-like protein/DNA-binding winged helix-turn-helix (wHTH) protein/Flp pilus assembly protein TadD